MMLFNKHTHTQKKNIKEPIIQNKGEKQMYTELSHEKEETTIKREHYK